LVVEVLDRGACYAPARPLDQITAHDVLTALRSGQGQELTTAADATREVLRAQFNRFYESEKAAAETVSLQTLAQETTPS
jgi:hypothetical protein